MNLRGLEAYSNQGPYLTLNEDGYFHDVIKNLYGVLDGFGGTGNGDVAVKKIIENTSSFYGQIVLDPDKTMPFYYSSRYTGETNSLINAMNYAHYKLMEINSSKSISSRAGSSALFSVLKDKVLSIVSVGNCSAYLVRSCGVYQLVLEDNLRLLCRNQEKPNSFSVPLNAFGMYEKLDFKVREIKIDKNDQIVFGSDGVFSRLFAEDIKQVFLLERDNRKRLEQLITLSNNRGNTDNQTLMLLQF